jgi:hypothetical protein
MCFFVYKSQSSNPQQVFVYVHCVGTRSKVFKVCLSVVGLGGWEFVLCTWYDVNLLHEIATMATW